MLMSEVSKHSGNQDCDEGLKWNCNENGLNRCGTRGGDMINKHAEIVCTVGVCPIHTQQISYVLGSC